MIKPICETGFKCPNPKCGMDVYIENLSKNEWAATEEGLEIICPHCGKFFTVNLDLLYQPAG